MTAHVHALICYMLVYMTWCLLHISPPSPSTENKSLVEKQKVLSRVCTLQSSLGNLKSELLDLRKSHAVKMEELSASLNLTSKRIATAVTAFADCQCREKKVSDSDMSRSRSELSGLKESYVKCSAKTLHNLQ